MTKIERRRKWKKDIIATEAWLNEMNLSGYALKEANFKTGKFTFENANTEVFYYRIGYDKNLAEVPEIYLTENGFEEVCCSDNYYVIKTKNIAPTISPSYDNFLDKSIRKKFIIGMVLLTDSLIVGILAISFFIAGLIGVIMGELEFGAFIFLMVFTLISSIPIWLLAAAFKRLAVINKKLESKCGNPLKLSWTIPQDTILSKEEIKNLKRNKNYVKKTKLGWFYAPDKAEKWLEQMESQGFNLVRMSKLGASFYFVKGAPRNVKFHVDYQNKTNPAYYNLHKDNGWKLFFTSPTRIQSFTVWAKEYNDEIPQFYSNNQSLLNHAKRLALTYSLLLLPLSIAYTVLVVWMALISYKQDLTPFLPIIITYPIVAIEFGYFALKTICYYFRIKKSTKSNQQDKP